MKQETLVNNDHAASLEQRRVESRANGYPNTFKRVDLAADLSKKYAEKEAETLANENKSVAIAGRVMRHRSSFLDLQDMSGRIQIYLDKKSLDGALWEKAKGLDLGDIIGVEGVLFKTKTNQLSVFVKKLTLLSKSLRPLPDKFHGLSDSDKEQRYRKRYLDLIVDEETRKTFKIRSQLIQGIRQFLNKQGYIEVETPMMHLLPGGALARPFTTHHNALNMELFLRVAPELHLKRLVVGGMEKVYEINRNFRNEGLSTRHNPEFTMLEFYQAYADYHDLMDLTEVMLRQLAEDILGSPKITYQEKTYDLSKPFRRMSVLNAILEFNPHYTMQDLTELSSIKQIAAKIKINPEILATDSIGKIQFAIFEETVEQNLLEPTFITEYPIAVSPLARRNDTNPEIADRFELYIAGRELANGFSELNDPEDQAARFQEQSEAKAQGDHEAMAYDEDYITALEYGLPPTAGEGIGIDRLAMLFTDSLSIRDVILFPLMRPER